MVGGGEYRDDDDVVTVVVVLVVLLDVVVVDVIISIVIVDAVHNTMYAATRASNATQSRRRARHALARQPCQAVALALTVLYV